MNASTVHVDLDLDKVPRAIRVVVEAVNDDKEGSFIEATVKDHEGAFSAFGATVSLEIADGDRYASVRPRVIMGGTVSFPLTRRLRNGKTGALDVELSEGEHTAYVRITKGDTTVSTGRFTIAVIGKAG